MSHELGVLRADTDSAMSGLAGELLYWLAVFAERNIRPWKGTPGGNLIRRLVVLVRQLADERFPSNRLRWLTVVHGPSSPPWGG